MGTLVSTGVSLGLVAGLAAGLLYLLCAGLRWAREQNKKSGVWLFKDLRSKFQSTVAAIHKSGRSEEDVREAIERMIEKLVGGNLDDVQVTHITVHSLYSLFMGKYEGVLSLTLSRLTASFQLLAEDFTSGLPGGPNKILNQLKHLIKEITIDAQRLPEFQKVNFISNLEDLASKSYEDILAIAILNKVIVDTQPYLSASVNHRIRKDNSSGLNGYGGVEETETEDEPQESDDDDVASVSADSFYAKDLNGWEDSSIEKDWEEEEATYDDNILPFKILFNSRTSFPEYGVDLVEAKNSKIGFEKTLDVNSWEENWLFKKRKLKQSINTSVTMLVPHPNEPANAFIGDQQAEETSELSDCSDSELQNLLNSTDDDWAPRDDCIQDIRAEQTNFELLSHARRGEDLWPAEGLAKGGLVGAASRLRHSTSHHFTVNPLFHDDSAYCPAPHLEQAFSSLQNPKKKRSYVEVAPAPEMLTTFLASLKDVRRRTPNRPGSSRPHPTENSYRR